MTPHFNYSQILKKNFQKNFDEDDDDYYYGGE